MKYWIGNILPSMQRVQFTAEKLADVKAPVLIIHGTKDRSAPYGGALDWSSMWPNVRLLTAENSAHAPWIESPEMVFDAITDFLEGK
ncbi:alpha/beta hydrolase [bacterium]|nr:alpha/beta hydrolase [bacterium]